MEPRPLSFVAAACAGELYLGDPQALTDRVCTDSRHVSPGDLFVAIAGEKFDGHEFLAEAGSKGIAAVLAARSQAGRVSSLPPAVGVILVQDPRLALGKLGARYRADFELPVVAVAGSNGKTTAKELLAAVLRQKFQTLWSEASFNNDIGVPLTLLKLERTHDAAVLEVGTNHPGELAPLVRMIQPRYGVITSIGREHLEFFGDLNGVAQEEGWLAELLPADGKLFINGDSEWAPAIERRTKARVISAGLRESNQWRAGNVRLDETGTTFQVFSPLADWNGEYRLSLLGRHQVLNALLALAVGRELGVSPEDACRGLAESKPAKMRLQMWETNGVRVLDDAYNANADSMIAALETLRDLPCRGRRLAVLGDMAELGEHAAAAHREVGRFSAEIGLARLIAVGRFAPETARAARDAGLRDVTVFDEVTDAAHAVTDLVERGDTVLLKASRATGLERVGAALRGTNDSGTSERRT